ncbi:MAG: hypothetical protein PUG75_09425, partial [Prevotella sp.]|nr:hypothetical protein [Prevotella sp.]
YIINVHVVVHLVRGRHKARPLQLMWVWCCSVVRCLRTHERTSLRLGCGVGARPAQGAATTTDVGLVRRLVRGRHKARPLQLMRVLVLLGCSLLADARTYVPTDWCEGWCEAGTRRGHYN